MIIVDIPFTREVDDDETCAILKKSDNLPPTSAVVEEILKIFKVMPEVRNQIKLKFKASKC